MLGARHVDAQTTSGSRNSGLGNPAQTVIWNFKTGYKTGYEIEVQLINPSKEAVPSPLFRFNVYVGLLHTSTDNGKSPYNLEKVRFSSLYASALIKLVAVVGALHLRKRGR